MSKEAVIKHFEKLPDYLLSAMSHAPSGWNQHVQNYSNFRFPKKNTCHCIQNFDLLG